MNIVTCNPSTELERFFETGRFPASPWSDFFFRSDAPVAGPRINIVENADAFTVEAEVPGWSESDIDLALHEGVLTLSGKQEGLKEEKNEDNGAAYQVREFAKRSFERSFRLGEQIDTDNVSAKLTDGVLTVTLKKKEEVKPKRVEIKVN